MQRQGTVRIDHSFWFTCGSRRVAHRCRFLFAHIGISQRAISRAQEALVVLEAVFCRPTPEWHDDDPLEVRLALTREDALLWIRAREEADRTQLIPQEN